MVNVNSFLKEIKEYAEENNVPIMTDEGINYLTNYIKKFNVQKILEIGTAIGYSAIMMALANPEAEITTIERDEKRYLEAIKNIKDGDVVVVDYENADTTANAFAAEFTVASPTEKVAEEDKIEHEDEVKKVNEKDNVERVTKVTEEDEKSKEEKKENSQQRENNRNKANGHFDMSV